MRVLVEEVLEHCELCVCEALARATRAADGGDGAGAHGRVVLGGDAGGRGGARQGHWGLDIDGGGVHWGRRGVFMNVDMFNEIYPLIFNALRASRAPCSHLPF